MFDSIHHRKEAEAMFRVCELVRSQLNAEHVEGKPIESAIAHLIGFYEVTSPRTITHLMRNTPDKIEMHVLHAMSTRILIWLESGQYVEWNKVREYFALTWPHLDIEEAIKPTQPTFITQGGTIVVGKTASVLLEKAGLGPDDGPKFNRVGMGRNFKHVEMEVGDYRPIQAFADLDQEILEKTDGKPPYPEATTPQEREAIRKLAEVPEEIKVALYRYWSAISARDVPIFFMWKSYPIFAVWAASNGYQLGYRLKREDKETGYVPSNVKWVPAEEVRK